MSFLIYKVIERCYFCATIIERLLVANVAFPKVIFIDKEHVVSSITKSLKGCFHLFSIKSDIIVTVKCFVVAKSVGLTTSFMNSNV